MYSFHLKKKKLNNNITGQNTSFVSELKQQVRGHWDGPVTMVSIFFMLRTLFSKSDKYQ